MSDAGKAKVYSLEESAWGATPAAAMNTTAGLLSATGGMQQEQVRSQVLRSDYVQPDTVPVRDTGDLTCPFELIYGDVPITDWIEGVARQDYAAVKSVTGTDISFTATATIASVTSDLSVHPVGSIIRIAGSATNDGLALVTASSATSLTVALKTIATAAAGPSVTIDNDGQLRGGAASPTLKSYTLERYFSDLTSTPYLAQAGQRPTGFNLDIPEGGIVTGSVSFAGKKPLAYAAATAGTGAANAATTNKPFNGANHVTAVFEGGAAVSVKVQQITLALASGTRFQHQLGSVDPWGVGGNSFAPTGTINVYNDDSAATLWAKFRSATLTSLYLHLTRDSNVLFFSLPSIALTGGNPDIGALDSDIMVPLSFNIDYSSTYSFMWAVDRFAA